MIRENIKEKFTNDFLTKWAAKKHLTTSYCVLEVSPVGDFFETEEPSDKDLPASPFMTLYKVYNKTPCDCELCTKYKTFERLASFPENNDNNSVLEAEMLEYNSLESFIESQVSKNGETNKVLREIKRKLKAIPEGFFVDEQKFIGETRKLEN